MSWTERLGARQEATGAPVRVGLVGAGQMGRGFAAQLGRMPGVAVSAVADIDPQRTKAALAAIGADIADDADARDDQGRAEAVAAGRSVALGGPSGLDDLLALPIDVVVEATGVADVGARVAVASLLAGKDVVTLNVESDVTVGALVHRLAVDRGRVYSVCRGDEPVEAKILVDFARDLGFEVVCAGKGKNNPLVATATPESLHEEAVAKGMNPKMLCSFVDGSKAMIEMAALANTTGLAVSRRGMNGPKTTVEGLSTTFALREDGGVLEVPGVVDYCTGPVAPGVFVVIRTDDPYVNDEMRYLKMGDGPYFTLYRPYHLASVEAPLTVYEVVLDRRPSLVAEHWTAEVGAVAKRPLAVGERIDGIGGSMVHGMIEDAGRFAAEGLVPLGVLAGAELVRPVEQGQLITGDDVALEASSAIVALRRLQDELLASGGTTAPSTDDLLAALAGGG